MLGVAGSCIKSSSVTRWKQNVELNCTNGRAGNWLVAIRARSITLLVTRYGLRRLAQSLWVFYGWQQNVESRVTEVPFLLSNCKQRNCRQVIERDDFCGKTVEGKITMGKRDGSTIIRENTIEHYDSVWSIVLYLF